MLATYAGGICLQRAVPALALGSRLLARGSGSLLCRRRPKMVDLGPEVHGVLPGRCSTMTGTPSFAAVLSSALKALQQWCSDSDESSVRGFRRFTTGKLNKDEYEKYLAKPSLTSAYYKPSVAPGLCSSAYIRPAYTV